MDYDFDFFPNSKGRVEDEFFMMCGSDEGFLKIKDLICEGEIDVNGTQFGSTPIWISASKGKYEISKFLLDNGANPNVGPIPLAPCSWNGDLKLVKLLVKYGASVNELYGGVSLLSLASCNGQIEVLKYLLKKGAIVNTTNHNDGSTPLTQACRKGHTTVIKKLIEFEADVNTYHYDGNSALMISCAKGNNEIVKMLLDANADANQKNTSGESPLFVAVVKNNLELATILYEANADVNYVNARNHKMNALHMAAHFGNLKLVRWLVEKGVDVNCEMDDGATALHIATLWENPEVSEFLAAQGADIVKTIEKAKRFNLEEVVSSLENILKRQHASK